MLERLKQFIRGSSEQPKGKQEFNPEMYCTLFHGPNIDFDSWKEGSDCRMTKEEYERGDWKTMEEYIAFSQKELKKRRQGGE